MDPTRSLAQSPPILPDEEPERQCRVGEGRRLGGSVDALTQVDTAPVREASLDEGDEHDEEGDGQDRSGRQVDAPGALGPQRTRPQEADRDERDDPEQHPGRQGLERHRQARRGGHADADRADHASERPAGVKTGEDRSSAARLEGHAVRVHRDVHEDVEGREHGHGHSQQQDVGSEQRQDRQEREDQGCRGEHAPARGTNEKLTGDLLRDERPDRGTEEHEPHLRRAGTEVRLDAGDGRHPGPHDGAVDDEQEERRDPRGHLPALNG